MPYISRRSAAVLLATLLVLAAGLLAVFPLLPTKADSSSWPATLATTGPTSLLSGTNEIVAFQNSVDSFQAFDSSGNSLGAAPFKESLNTSTSTAVDSAGNIYTLTDGVSPNLVSKINAFAPTGSVRWSTNLTTICPAASQSVQLTAFSIVVGSDGNLYLLAEASCNGNVYYLVKINSGDGSVAFANQLSGYPYWLGAYQHGLVLQLWHQAIEYLDFGGNVTSSVPISLGSDYTEAVRGADYNGNVAVIFWAYPTDSTFCPASWNGQQYTSRIVEYGPEGQLFTYRPTSCGYTTDAVLTTSGNVVLRSTDTNNQTHLTLLVNGQVAQDKVYSGEQYDLVPDTNGHVLYTYSYQQSGSQYDDWGFLLLDGNNLSQVGSFDTTTLDSSQTGLSNLTFAMADYQLYIAADNCSSTSGCSTRLLYSEPMAGLGFDYPRGAVLGSQPAPCPALQFIGVMGSGERSTYKKYGFYGQEVSAVKDTLLKQFPTMATMAINYPAVKIDPTTVILPSNYVASVKMGEKNLYSTLSAFNIRCPTTPIALVGYSQGAEVVGDVVQQLPLPAIAGVLLFGDPLFNPKQSAVDRGTYVKTFEGLVAALGGFPPRTVYPIMIGRFVSYCLKGDLVCNSNPQNLGKCPLGNTCPHYHYTPSWTEQGAQWLAGKLP